MADLAVLLPLVLALLAAPVGAAFAASAALSVAWGWIAGGRHVIDPQNDRTRHAFGCPSMIPDAEVPGSRAECRSMEARPSRERLRRSRGG